MNNYTISNNIGDGSDVIKCGASESENETIEGLQYLDTFHLFDIGNDYVHTVAFEAPQETLMVKEVIATVQVIWQSKQTIFT